MASLPSPPLSPINHPYNSSKTVCPPKIGYKKTHRHPDRRRDTYEILQALMTEHQRLEQLEYENMLNDLPSISCNSMDNAPKGILVNKNKNKNNHQHKNYENHHYIPTTTLPSISLPPLPPHDKNHHGSTSKLSPNDNNATSISLPSLTNQRVSSNTSSISITSSNNNSSNNNNNNNNNTRQSVRFAPGPPKVYSYPKVQV